MDRPHTVTRRHDMPFGAVYAPSGTLFRLWAPRCDRVELEIDGASPAAMERDDNGWHRALIPAAPGTRYRFHLPDGTAVPDPASRHLPEGVHGWSELIDPEAHAWRDGDWTGRPWREAVIEEIHVGTFTPEGTFRAAADRLEHLAALGITAVQLMPVGDFAGERNWGYDGVQPYAPARCYGRPDDLKAFVERAHGAGLMVFLDVIYNHFGPDGNYLPAMAPVFTEKHRSPWGAGVNYDDAGSEWVRAFAIHNALYWLEEYNLDGLRLDAIHAIEDDGPVHLVDELAARVRAAFPHRPVHLIVENEENEARRLERTGGFPLIFTAQWNDDVHHVLHTAVTGETGGYYADYANDTDRLGRALAEGFAFQGEEMAYRGSARGEPSGHLPPTAFVAFLQNHDQIGNRAFGDRLSTAILPEAIRAATAAVMLSPQIPMLFQGEEWGALEPFPFFCDFHGELADAVREGRRKEFARFPGFHDPARRAEIPDPNAEATFRSAKLDWTAPERQPHAARLDWMRRLIAVRRLEIVPRLAGIEGGGAYEVLESRAVALRWRLGDGSRYRMIANFSADEVAHEVRPEERIIWAEGTAGPAFLGPWTVLFTLHAD
jgi:malto-oligosyltrehalose trehalohydrolase